MPSVLGSRAYIHVMPLNRDRLARTAGVTRGSDERRRCTIKTSADEKLQQLSECDSAGSGRRRSVAPAAKGVHHARMHRAAIAAPRQAVPMPLCLHAPARELDSGQNGEMLHTEIKMRVLPSAEC